MQRRLPYPKRKGWSLQAVSLALFYSVLAIDVPYQTVADGV